MSYPIPNDQTAQNTDREIWREKDDYYAPSIFVTQAGSIGINVGGMCHVRPVRVWHSQEERIAKLEQQIAAKDAELEALKAEVESLVRSIDEEMVSCHIGVFERGDDPKKAINELMAWSQGVGEYFSKDKANHYYVANTKLTEEIAALKAEVERLRVQFGRGPHLLTARNGSQALCGGKGVCPACERDTELTSLREQVARLSAPLTHKEWKKNFILNATDDVYSEDKDGFDGVIAARLEGK